MHVLLIVTCDNCVSESKLSPKLFAAFLGSKTEETSTEELLESVSDSTSNRILTTKRLLQTGYSRFNNSKCFTKTKLALKTLVHFFGVLARKNVCKIAQCNCHREKSYGM